MLASAPQLVPSDGSCSRHLAGLLVVITEQEKQNTLSAILQLANSVFVVLAVLIFTIAFLGVQRTLARISRQCGEGPGEEVSICRRYLPIWGRCFS
jgi:hypothetical protein